MVSGCMNPIISGPTVIDETSHSFALCAAFLPEPHFTFLSLFLFLFYFYFSFFFAYFFIFISFRVYPSIRFGMRSLLRLAYYTRN